MRMVGELFDYGSSGAFYYIEDNHTSVIGMREYARARHARICCLTTDTMLTFTAGICFCLDNLLFWNMYIKFSY